MQTVDTRPLCLEWSKLGLVVSGTGGTFRRGINKLQQQAKRSTFGVLRHLRKLAHGRLPVDTLCHAFRTLILPMMTYAAEVWAYDVGIAYKKMMTSKFLKYHSKCSSIVRAWRIPDRNIPKGEGHKLMAKCF